MIIPNTSWRNWITSLSKVADKRLIDLKNFFSVKSV